MAKPLTSDENATVTVLLQTGKTIKEISKFADLDREAVTSVARQLDITPSDKTQRRAKELYASDEGLTYAEVAQALQGEGLKADGAKVHYLTVAGWVANRGWAWGGAGDGDYNPERAPGSAARSRYTLRMSKTLDAEVNAPKAIARAADAAWAELESDRTRVVAVAVVKGAAAVGVTDIAAVKGKLMDSHGEAIRSAKA